MNASNAKQQQSSLILSINDLVCQCRGSIECGVIALKNPREARVWILKVRQSGIIVVVTICIDRQEVDFGMS